MSRKAFTGIGSPSARPFTATAMLLRLNAALGSGFVTTYRILEDKTAELNDYFKSNAGERDDMKFLIENSKFAEASALLRLTCNKVTDKETFNLSEFGEELESASKCLEERRSSEAAFLGGRK